MADFNTQDQKIVLNSVESTLSGFTHVGMDVAVSSTLKNGSLVLADGSEAAKAAAADVVGIVDDLMMRVPDDLLGTTAHLAVIRTGCIVNEDLVVFSDGAIDSAGKAALEALGIRFGTIKSI